MSTRRCPGSVRSGPSEGSIPPAVGRSGAVLHSEAKMAADRMFHHLQRWFRQTPAPEATAGPLYGRRGCASGKHTAKIGSAPKTDLDIFPHPQSERDIFKYCHVGPKGKILKHETEVPLLRRQVDFAAPGENADIVQPDLAVVRRFQPCNHPQQRRLTVCFLYAPNADKMKVTRIMAFQSLASKGSKQYYAYLAQCGKGVVSIDVLKISCAYC